MSPVEDFYLNVFSKSDAYNASEKEINISVLPEEKINWSPIVLEYSNKNESMRKLAAVMIMNFCSTNQKNEKFCKQCMVNLTNIIRGDCDSTDNVAQQIFMVHITKGTFDANFFFLLTRGTDSMKIKTLSPNDDESKWLQLAQKVMIHKQSHGDFNMHSPVVAELKGLPKKVHPYEFGIYAEKKIFSKQMDWFHSHPILDFDHVGKFIEAIENDTALPPGVIGGAIPRSGRPYVDGADLHMPTYVC